MAHCIYCGGPNDQARVDIGYTHCKKVDCVGAWRRRRLDEKGLVVVKQHKQGLAWIKHDEVKLNDMKRAGGRK